MLLVGLAWWALAHALGSDEPEVAFAQMSQAKLRIAAVAFLAAAPLWIVGRVCAASVVAGHFELSGRPGMLVVTICLIAIGLTCLGFLDRLRSAEAIRVENGEFV